MDSETAPTYVRFTNTFTNANNYKWDFGDGTTSTEKNPVLYYKGLKYSVAFLKVIANNTGYSVGEGIDLK